jgi:PleD family two-component response regulator
VLACKGELRLLVVDDDRDTVEATVLLLQNLGYQVVPAYEAETALAIAAKWSPHVIMLDAAMPRYDGYRLAAALRQLATTEHAVIICVSGYGREEDRQHAFDAGCDYHFIKPIDSWEDAVRLIEQAAAERLLLQDKACAATSQPAASLAQPALKECRRF